MAPYKKPQKVLIVEDEKELRWLMMRAFLKENLHNELAEDGTKALHLLSNDRFDAVVTDLRMPNQHGYSLINELLEMEARPSIMVVTGVAEPRLVKDLISRGVEDISFKPVDPMLYAAKISALLARNAAA